jgi:hypothetical protein
VGDREISAGDREISAGGQRKHGEREIIAGGQGDQVIFVEQILLLVLQSYLCI